MARAEAGWINDFRARHNISGQTTQLILAGVVALIVLAVALVQLPRSATTASKTTGASEAGGDLGYGPTDSGGNVPHAGSAGGLSSVGVPGSSGGTGGGAASGSAPAPGAPGSARVSSRFIPARAPGITNTTIYVGVGYSSQAASADRAIGAAGAAPTYDTRDVFNTAINYANKHGGFAGRRMQGIYFDYNVTDDSNTQDQAACAHWTQDHKVFALGAGGDILNTCAEKAGGIPWGGGATAATYKKYPHLIHPLAIRLDRLAVLTVRGLHRAKYFTGKLGMVTWDDPDYRAAMTQAYLPTLRQLGIKVTDVAYIYVPQTLQALGDSTASVSSAVAKFKSQGIDHVIIQDGSAGVFGGTGLTFEWMNQAKSQRYYPRYGQNTGNSPGWSVLPSDQMDRAIAIDHADYDKKFDEGWRTNVTRERCFKMMADAGYPVNSSNANDEVIAGSACDMTSFFQRVLNKSSLITNDNFIKVAATLGTSFPSAVVYGTKFVSGRRDGGGMMRTEEYFDSCKCLKFTSKPAYSD
jgi:hypothetical protein